jgi:hypothetical protein
MLSIQTASWLPTCIYAYKQTAAWMTYFEDMYEQMLEELHVIFEKQNPSSACVPSFEE